MSDEKTPDFWQMMFEQTPVIIRAALGFLTLGMFTLATMIYKINRQDMGEIRKLHREDMDRIHNRIGEVEHKMDVSFSEVRGYLMASQKRDWRIDHDD